MNASSKDIELRKKIDLVINQTTYNEIQALEELTNNKFDPILVIKHYLGGNGKKQTGDKQTGDTRLEEKPLNINQEIYKQIRFKMSNIMKEYNDKHPINMEQVQQNFDSYS
jgi:hypothetical protein